MNGSVRWLAIVVVCSGLLSGVALGEEDGFVSMFNGQDLTGWKGDSHWSVEDGALTGRTTPDTLLKYNTFLVWQGGEPSDFELKLQYRIVGGNSGVQYRSRVVDSEKLVVSGYQADIDSGQNYSGMNYEEKARGFLAERGQKSTIGADGSKEIESIGDKAELQKKIHDEDWNEYHIIARGNHLQHYINGVLMSEVIDSEEGKAASSGVIAIQAHAGPPMTIQVKDIRIREYK